MSEGRQYRERLQYQLRFAVDKKRFPTKGDRDNAIAAARKHFLKTGESLPGVKIEARWRNPDNKNPRHSEWKHTTDPDQSLYGFWASLGRGRGALR